MRFEQMFDCLNVISCSDEVRDRVPDDWSNDCPCSWHGVVAAARRT